jgi:lysozyme
MLTLFRWLLDKFKPMPESQPTNPEPQEAVAADTSLEQEFEGFSSVPYPDPISGGEPWTYAFGSTHDLNGNPVTASTPPISRAQGVLLLSRDVHQILQQLAIEVKVPLTPNEASAIADLIYNIGNGNFTSSTLLKKLNVKDYTGAALEFDRWDLASGKVIAGLLRRRQAETAEFIKTG